jgi:hypothetical protein
MRYFGRNTALGLGLLALGACGGGGGDFTAGADEFTGGEVEEVNLAEMSCSERADTLSGIIDRREPQSEEERRLKAMVSGAEQDCLAGDERAFDEIVAVVEDRRWINDQDIYAGSD